jgi:hypothetical protein
MFLHPSQACLITGWAIWAKCFDRNRDRVEPDPIRRWNSIRDDPRFLWLKLP